jgi:hypothetical protein
MKSRAGSGLGVGFGVKNAPVSAKLTVSRWYPPKVGKKNSLDLGWGSASASKTHRYLQN